MRKCLFCPEVAATLEDAWPLWLMGHFDAPRGVSVDLTREDHRLPTWTKTRHGHKVRFVCGSCNNGWMSQLERRAKPIIERLLVHGGTLLEPPDQATLSAWAMKGAMVFEALRDRLAPFYSDSERSAFRQSLVLTPNTVVWLATCVDLPGLYAFASDHADTPDHSPAGTRVFVTTMGFGHVALQTATVKVAAPMPTLTPDVVPLLDGPWREATLRVSESDVPLNWPPKVPLEGLSGLQAFARRWFTP
jgi:hypothetical protein